MKTTEVYYGCPSGLGVFKVIQVCVNALTRFGFEFSRPEQRRRFDEIWSVMDDGGLIKDLKDNPLFNHFHNNIFFEFEAKAQIRGGDARLCLTLSFANDFPVRRFRFSLCDHELDLNHMLIHEMVAKDQAECYERLYRMFKDMFKATDSTHCVGTSNYSHAGLEDLDSTRGFLFRKDGPQELCGPLEDGLYEFCQLSDDEFYYQMQYDEARGCRRWLRIVDKPFAEIYP